uniref:Uncharacterized protein n=1 Tax=Anopheles atroparvus TaxID=41427 RepID=A0A182J717_ANOAO
MDIFFVIALRYFHCTAPPSVHTFDRVSGSLFMPRAPQTRTLPYGRAISCRCAVSAQKQMIAKERSLCTVSRTQAAGAKIRKQRRNAHRAKVSCFNPPSTNHNRDQRAKSARVTANTEPAQPGCLPLASLVVVQGGAGRSDGERLAARCTFRGLPVRCAGGQIAEKGITMTRVGSVCSELVLLWWMFTGFGGGIVAGGLRFVFEASHIEQKEHNCLKDRDEQQPVRVFGAVQACCTYVRSPGQFTVDER